jgi:D-beta-D-heptose 7-phosphate kinase/D-beta-D-heptose 1-phosphate adenosyltransferase
VTAPLVVIGDVMLDVDRCGQADRLSPEAPVPVLHDLVEKRRPGGAALAALLAARRADRPVILIAPMADDEAAAEIHRLLAGRLELIAVPWTGSTPVKIRLRAGDHPVARLDEGGRLGVVGPLPARATRALAAAGGLLVADYGLGVSADPMLRQVISEQTRRIPVLWDPHPRGSAAVPGTALLTPNETELRAFGGSGSSSIAELRSAAGGLAQRWSSRAVCVTLGARGAMLVQGDDLPFLVAAPRVSGKDTCGAGDCFAAVAALALTAGALPSEAVVQAVEAAAGFVAAGGAAELECAGRSGVAAVAAARSGVEELLARTRQRGGTVVATGGCFDLLHAGHIATLQAARALGDCLVVCLNSDDSVRRLKGPQRPLQSAADRAEVLSALQCVDAVVVFDEDTPATALRRLRPDIWAKGGDYSGMVLPEVAVLAEWGGEAVTVPYLAGRSTTALVESASALGGSASALVGSASVSVDSASAPVGSGGRGGPG